MIARGIFDTDAVAIARALPGLGRAMVISRRGGTTHERIGRVESVDLLQDGWITLGGAAHEARFDPARIAAIRFDRTAGMADKLMPRLSFLDAAGAEVFAVVALSGLAEFDAAFGGFAARPVDPGPAEPPGLRQDLAGDDPALAPLEAAVSAGHRVELRHAHEGFSQAWTGVIAAIKPAMGFVNVMTEDFHLHLKGGSVGRWANEGEITRALDPAGQPTGLTLRVLAP